MSTYPTMMPMMNAAITLFMALLTFTPLYALNHMLRAAAAIPEMLGRPPAPPRAQQVAHLEIHIARIHLPAQPRELVGMN